MGAALRRKETAVSTWERERSDDERRLDDGDEGTVTEAGELAPDLVRVDAPEADTLDQQLDVPLGDEDDDRR
jgi:hypothetical protein